MEAEGEGGISYVPKRQFLFIRLFLSHPGGAPVHAAGFLQHCGSDHDWSAGQRQRGRCGPRRKICFDLFRDRVRRGRCRRYHDFSVPGAEKPTGGAQTLSGEPADCGGAGRGVYPAVRRISGPDHGPVHHRRTHAAVSFRLSANYNRHIPAPRRGHAAVHPTALHG